MPLHALTRAKSQGNPLAVLRAEHLVKSATSAAPILVTSQLESNGPGEPGTIGPTSTFPAGGKPLEDATLIKVGRYVWKEL
jgi:hypothetical protein